MSGKVFLKRLEKDIQKTVVEWIYMQYPNILMTIAPNIKKSVQQGVMLKRMGLRAGTPDLLIFEPRHTFHGLLIELKRDKGGIKSDAQKEFIKEALSRGYWAQFCAGYDEAVEVVKWYMGGAK